MKTFLITAAILLPSAAGWAECVHLVDGGLKIGEEQDLPAVTWQAEFKNECKAYVDITVNVDLLDKQDQSIYTLNAVESFGFRESRKVEKQVHVPDHVAQEAVGIRIETEEHQRPIN